MKQFRFILLCATIAVISSSLTGCKKGVYDEKAALAAQKELLQFKYDQEIKLENLRQTGATALETAKQNLQYSFSVRTALFNDSLSKAKVLSDKAALRRRDIFIKVKDLVSGVPVVGAEVTIPTTVGTVIKAKTDSLGIAKFAPNENIPFPASAIATMDGYAAGSVFGTIGGNYNYYYGTTTEQSSSYATINIWNTKNAPNTVKGRIYIENDLTNDAPEVAKKAFVNAFTFVTITDASLYYNPITGTTTNNNYEQRFDFTTTTDDNGDYSMKVPNLTSNLQMAHAALEGTSKMYINSYVPGMDTVPTLKSIDATYFLGTASVKTLKGDYGNTATFYSLSNTGGSYEAPNNTLTQFTIPTSVDRYNVAAAADSNGRGHYVEGIGFTRSTLSTSASLDSAFLTNAGVGSNLFTTSSLTSGASYSANTPTPSTRYSSKYKAGTTVRDTVDATLYDLLANADGYWKTVPVLKFVLLTDSTGNKFKYIEKLIQKTGGKIIKDDVNFTHQTTLYNFIKTISNIKESDYNSRNINVGFATISPSVINNGKIYIQDLSFGAGKLKTAVR
jgi:hypothetical protein